MTQPSAHGKRIVVTRARHQAKSLVDRIMAIGAIPLLYPCIAIAPPDDTIQLDHHLYDLEQFDWVIFTSPNTVSAISDRLLALDYQSNWETIRIASVGDKTATIVKDILQQTVDFIPTIFTAYYLGKQLPDVDNKRIFLPQSELADDTLANILTDRGADVIQSTAYQNTIGSGGDDIPALLQNNQIDMITFTSSSTVTQFVQRIAPLSAYDIPALCIGPSTAKTAESQRFSRVIVPNEYSLAGMTERMIEYFNRSTSI